MLFLKLKKIYKYIVAHNYAWEPPENKTVLILSDTGSSHIVAALDDLNYFIFKDSDIVYVKQILLTIFADLNFNFSDIMFWYYVKVFNAVNPKLIITFVDNEQLYWRLDKYISKDITFLTIQNGTHYVREHNITYGSYDHWFLNEPPFYSNFACFSQFDYDYYCSKNSIINNFFPIGNVLISDYIAKYSHKRKIFDICVISHSDNSGHCYRKMFSYVLKYAKSRDVNVCIALKRDYLYHDFKNHFSDFYNDTNPSNVFIIPRAGHSSQYLSDSSEVIIGRTGTTVLRQVFSRGNKIYPINFSSEELSTPFELLGFTLSPKYEEFESHLDYLLSIEGDKYIEKNIDSMKYLDTFDIDNPPAERLRDLVGNLLNKKHIIS